MLIRKPQPKAEEGLPDRLERLLSLYEKNLRLEVFFIERKDIESLLDILPAQGDLIQALSSMLPDLRLPEALAEALQKRLEAADALRESNKKALDQAMHEVSSELEQMSGARQRIRQMRQLSKSMYQETNEPARMQIGRREKSPLFPEKSRGPSLPRAFQHAPSQAGLSQCGGLHYTSSALPHACCSGVSMSAVGLKIGFSKCLSRLRRPYSRLSRNGALSPQVLVIRVHAENSWFK
jgi:hypothetical protein